MRAKRGANLVGDHGGLQQAGCHGDAVPSSRILEGAAVEYCIHRLPWCVPVNRCESPAHMCECLAELLAEEDLRNPFITKIQLLLHIAAFLLLTMIFQPDTGSMYIERQR